MNRASALGGKERECETEGRDRGREIETETGRDTERGG